MKFTYGFTTKTVHGKRYVYFWRYTGSGHKTEKYIGPAGKAETERKALQVEFEYLQGLQQELTSRILKVKDVLAQGESSQKDRRIFQEMYKKS